MMNSNPDTRIDEIADGIFRISTRLPDLMPGGFTFNQFLIRDDESALFHAGPKGLFPAVRDAVAMVLPPERLRYIAYSHYEADECGSLDAWLSIAPAAEPVASTFGAGRSGGGASASSRRGPGRTPCGRRRCRRCPP